MSTIDDYLQTVKPEERKELERVRRIVVETVQGTEEGISYGMPAIFYKGKPLVSVMATKKFLSLYPFSGKVAAKLEKDLEGFETTPGSIHFSQTHPLPEGLVKKILAARIEEIEEKLAK